MFLLSETFVKDIIDILAETCCCNVLLFLDLKTLVAKMLLVTVPSLAMMF